MNKTRLRCLLAVFLIVMTTGCEPEVRVVRSSWDSLPTDPKPKSNPAAERYKDPAGGQGWAIQVIQFSGQSRHSQTMGLIKQLREEAALADMWIEDINDTATIYHGRFPSASDPAVNVALNKVRMIELESERPFAKSVVVPLIGGGRAIADPFDLRQFIGYYSLQIGFYDAAFGDNFREAAEQAVRVLREDGHDAYYYHGPHRSIITIGVFDYEQAFITAGTVDTYAPVIRDLQAAFPYNLSNGLTLKQKVNGKDIGEQKSSLIRVF